MSTQHPDNATVPDWCNGTVLEADAGIYEAYLAYESLGRDEVRGDSEGKDADTRVVRKLLNTSERYFSENELGKDIFLTYRIPNPRIDVIERKIVVETLQNIPVGCDVSSAFYRKESVPIFEVILPFATDGKELVWLYTYYKKAIVSTEEMTLNGSMKVKDWIGSFNPKNIEVIPLVEDLASMVNIDRLLDPYVKVVRPKSIRVFIARSDPALNYGLFSAVILTKIALSKLGSFASERGVAIHPMLGVGSLPFRGHLSPDNIEGFLREYNGISTVTIQSALKYDYPLERVREAVGLLNEKLPNGQPKLIEPYDENVLLNIVAKFKSTYQRIVEEMAPLVNSIASYVPKRRSRKLHIGLFGYSRNVEGVHLPRAIPFAAAFYSIGIPPEFIGAEALNKLSENEWETLRKGYNNVKYDLDLVGGYLSWQNVNMLMEMYQQVANRAEMSEEKLKSGLTHLLADLKATEEKLGIRLGPKNLSQRKYENVVGNFLISYLEQDDDGARASLVEAARLRRCIG